MRVLVSIGMVSEYCLAYVSRVGLSTKQATELYSDNFLGVPKPGCFKSDCLQFLRGSALLHSFADWCLRSFALICALLRSFAWFCGRPRLEWQRLGTPEKSSSTVLRRTVLKQRDSPQRNFEEVALLVGFPTGNPPQTDTVTAWNRTHTTVLGHTSWGISLSWGPMFRETTAINNEGVLQPFFCCTSIHG